MSSEQKDYSPLVSDFTKQYTYRGNTKPRVVVTAANKVIDEHGADTGLLLVGARHCDKVMVAQSDLLPLGHNWVHNQGFIDQYGQYLTREEAMTVATTNGQTLIGEDWGELYSENLH